MKRLSPSILAALLIALATTPGADASPAGATPAARLTVAGDRFLLDGAPFKPWGIRWYFAAVRATAGPDLTSTPKP